MRHTEAAGASLPLPSSPWRPKLGERLCLGPEASAVREPAHQAPRGTPGSAFLARS